MALLRKVDRSGILDGIEFPIEDLSLVTGIPVEIVEKGLEKLQKAETVKIVNDNLIIVNYLEAQSAKQSDKQRKKVQRERRRAKALSPINEKEQPKKTTKYTEDFEQFWEAYPSRRKTKKNEAFKAWQKNKSNMPPIEELLKILETQKKSRDWTKDDGEYIPGPTPWINQGRWDDEINTEDTRSQFDFFNNRKEEQGQ